jgi:23S rRNA G2069 N7-methylase RlmK/C1962 C5-methylase RlmI
MKKWEKEGETAETSLLVASASPSSNVLVPKSPFTIDKTRVQAEMLVNRLRKRYRHLCKWARRIGCDAFRLYDRDIPEIPLVLDVYAMPGTAPASAISPEHNAGPLSWAHDHAHPGPFVAGALYKRPYDKPPAEEAVWLAAMRTAIAEAMNMPEDNIFLKQRERLCGAAQYTKRGERNVTTIAHENGMRFLVNLSDYLDTGLFLDARKVRAWLRDSCGGKRVLNLFCYTGSLSVAAAKGGAVSVDSVDLSSTYLEWAQKNFALNELTGPRHTDKRHQFIRADALQFVKRARRDRQKWDFLILDPPVFSNSKKMPGIFDIKRDHPALIQDCLSLLAKDGTLLFGAKLKGFVLDTLSYSAVPVSDITLRMKDEDFKTKNRGKWYVFQKGETAANCRGKLTEQTVGRLGI